ncbi:hypothetical protein [Streptomyces griseocarneus]|uniref:Uncharacterized protein n=1 Tax=Streptomyces griseocarneus TaxID=51201 RepID=A0ABX7RSY8_9ACTN|nr:hypothetical protein [Streptomyces griseocarneus]QSY51424.1 hypothetical protein J3S04_11455 [Streptomyces griseocarneus]
MLAYSVGVWGVLLGDAPDWCPTVRFSGDPALPGNARTEQSAFPLSARCVSDVHATVEMVPGFVNPAIVVCLVGAVTFAGMAGVKRWRKSGGTAAPAPADSARA